MGDFIGQLGGKLLGDIDDGIICLGQMAQFPGSLFGAVHGENRKAQSPEAQYTVAISQHCNFRHSYHAAFPQWPLR